MRPNRWKQKMLGFARYTKGDGESRNCSEGIKRN